MEQLSDLKDVFQLRRNMFQVLKKVPATYRGCHDSHQSHSSSHPS